MVMIDSGACDAACQEKLYQTRQIRTMLGKERERVERWWLITDQVIPSHDLIALHPDLKLLFVANKSLENLPLQPGATLADHVYLIDPRGHLMMRYPPKPDPMKIKKDLDKLLKASSIG